MSEMLTLKASVAATVLAGTVLVTAGATYLATKTTMQARVTVSCPSPAVSSESVKPDLPRGAPVPLTGYKSW